MKIVRIAAVALLVLVVGAVAGVGRPEPAQGVAAAEEPGGITVNGTGAVSTTPDVADLGFGVVNQAATARAALSANAADARKIVAALKEAGVAAADIQTQQTSLDPRYSEGDRTVAGYTATTIVSVVVRNLGKVAATMDAAVAAGANTVSGPSLSRSNAAALYNDALRAAVADARAKAALLASAGGVTLGRVTSVVESGIGPVDAKAAERTAVDAPSVEPGTQRIEATVTVTYAIS